MKNKNFNIIEIKSLKLKNSFLVFLIYLIWIGLIYATQATDIPALGIHSIYSFFGYFYNTHQGNSFPGFEFITFIFIFTLIFTYKNNYVVPGRSIKIFFFMTMFFVISALLNPNNYFEGGLYNFLKMRITRSLIFMFLFSYSILFLGKDRYLSLLITFFKVGLYVAASKAMFDLVVFMLGVSAINHFDKQITTIGGDIQSWYNIFHIMTFSFYLYSKNRKYLYLSILFLLCLVFSYQRTQLFITIIFDAIFYITYSVLFQRKISKLFFIPLILLIIINIIIPSIKNTPFGSDLIYRYGSALQFTGLISVPEERGYNDSGHFYQSIITTKFFLENITEYLGGGINRRSEYYLYIEGQSSGGVHNNIVSMWQFFGIPGVIYLLYLFLFFLYYTIRILRNKNQILLNKYFILIVSIYFCIRTIVGWVSGDFFFMHFQSVLQVLILVSIVKLFNINMKKLII